MNFDCRFEVCTYCAHTHVPWALQEAEANSREGEREGERERERKREGDRGLCMKQVRDRGLCIRGSCAHSSKGETAEISREAEDKLASVSTIDSTIETSEH